MIADIVRDQYEAYPYPERDPADEARRLITGSPSHILEIEHYVYGGRRDFARPFRALAAGGGTGDAAIMMAQQLADAGCPAEIVHLDLSAASQEIARRRAEARGLANIRFVRGALEEVAALAPGPWDYIDCCGVLHHLADPDAGLAALAGTLAPHGGIGLMVYAPYGRTGVYPAQEMLRLVAGDGTLAGRVRIAKSVLAALPQTNWLVRNPFVTDHREAGDAGLYDLLLHGRDRPYTVPQLAALIDGAGLRLAALVEPARYRPEAMTDNPEILKRLDGLSLVERAAFAELFAGNIKRHVAYAVRADNAVAPADPGSPDIVPVLRDIDGPSLARGATRGAALTSDLDGIKLRFPMPALAPEILGLIDGRQTLGAIHARLASGGNGPDWADFANAFSQLYDALGGLNLMMLRR